MLEGDGDRPPVTPGGDDDGRPGAALDAPAREQLVLAAGGVVRRRDAAGRGYLLAVVHRPRYDDWSLPKGKLEPGESFEDAAVREVEEETGMRCELGEELASHRYVDRKGRDKVVRWWRMSPVATRPFVANDEVDELRWIRAGEAATLLTYDADRKLVAEVLQ
jgi:8-oxo-dGTP diphosphatase